MLINLVLKFRESFGVCSSYHHAVDVTGLLWMQILYLYIWCELMLKVRQSKHQNEQVTWMRNFLSAGTVAKNTQNTPVSSWEK